MLICSASGCGGSGEATADASSQAPKAPAKLVEVDLGEYFVTLRIDEAERAYFRVGLVGLVDETHADELTMLLETRKERMRERIENTLQSTSIDYLKQPGMPIVKTELATAIKKVLHTPHLHEIIYTSYSLRQG
ncbi:flagellar basal body-associated FliL family protein [Lignipirellula cremea]|uniref:flagellar basal body-associated FliL family protein n=1 Tax=Lignipirellula cremea TaxID=2528010 RepID=UPI0011A8A633|nr:flagellar basal body-associated FliL family protein [Lignipirellula cremea]